MIAINCRPVMLVLTMLALAPASVFGDDMPEPEGFRTENYRAPTPATLRGARVVTTAEAQEIWQRGGAVFVDVLPRPPRPANLPAGTIWRETPRLSIPGSVWLPDTGYGSLAPTMENYLRTNVAHAAAMTGQGRLSSTAYVPAGCPGMQRSRILAMGYTQVVWYPDGTDGWSEANLPFSCRRRNRGQSNSHLLWGGCGGSVMRRMRCRPGCIRAVEARSRPGTEPDLTVTVATISRIASLIFPIAFCHSGFDALLHARRKLPCH